MEFDLKYTITSICKAVLLRSFPQNGVKKTNKSIGNYWGLNFDDDRILPPEVDTCATCYCISILAESLSIELEDIDDRILNEIDQKLVLGIKTIVNLRNPQGFWPATVRLDKNIVNDEVNYCASIGDTYFALNALLDCGFLDRKWIINVLAKKYHIDLNIDLDGINARITFVSKTIEWLDKIIIRSTMNMTRGFPFNVIVKDGIIQNIDKRIPSTTVTANLMLVFVRIIEALDKIDCLEIETAKELKEKISSLYNSLIKLFIRDGISEYGNACSSKNKALVPTVRLLEVLIKDAKFRKQNHSDAITRVFNNLKRMLPSIEKDEDGKSQLNFGAMMLANPSIYIETYKITYLIDGKWYEEKILRENFIEGILANCFISLFNYNEEKQNLTDCGLIKAYIDALINNIFKRCHQIEIDGEEIRVCMGYVPRSSGFYPVYSSYLAYKAMKEASKILDESETVENNTKLEKILSIKTNKDYFYALKREMSNVVPFIGAGLSRPLGYPLWDRALTMIRERSNFSDIIDKNVSDLIASGKYFEAAEIIRKEMSKESDSPFYNAISNLFDDKIMEKADVSNYPIGRIPYLFSDRLIITTNFDRAIENIFAKIGKHIERITPMQLESQSEKLINSVAENRSILFKMHGDYEDKYGIIFDKESYDKYYGIEGSDEKTILELQLSRVLKSKHLLFLGASLIKDRTLDVIRDIVDTTDDSLWHYAFVECDINNKNAIRERAKELNKLRIHPIFFPTGEFEYINILFDNLDN